MLRTLALMRVLEPEPKVLINLEPKNFEEDGRRAAAAMERALELMTHVGPTDSACSRRSGFQALA